MEKVDVAPLRAAVLAEYRNFPNPNNDPVTAFENRAAAVIADFAVFMVQEHNERGTPDPVLTEGVVSVATIMMQQIIAFAHPSVQPKIVAHALATFEHFLTGGGVSAVGAIEITHKDVGDA